MTRRNGPANNYSRYMPPHTRQIVNEMFPPATHRDPRDVEPHSCRVTVRYCRDPQTHDVVRVQFRR